MAAKRKSKNGLGPIVGIVIVPLLIINTYAFVRLNETAGHWTMAVFNNDIASTMTQLAIILAINTGIIIFLLIHISIFK